MIRPVLHLLHKQNIQNIIDQAFTLLGTTGIHIPDGRARRLLLEYDVRKKTSDQRLTFSPTLIEKALKSVPQHFSLYDRAGELTHQFNSSRTYFAPGSAAIDIFDLKTDTHRKPLTADYRDYVRILDQLPHIHAQSTAFIPADVPDGIADSYRLFLSLLEGKKPVITGAFKADSVQVMTDLQIIIRGSKQELSRKPLCVFSCCPSSPLKWSYDTAENIVDCAQNDIPVELIAMPLSGFLAPVTLMDTIIQHTAETLSGIVISQLAKPGAPLLYGGSPAVFDMRFQTTPMGAIETMMIICAYNEIGKYLQIPTQAYIAISDSKSLDMQAGFETGMGALLAVLSGIDNVSGPGMIDFESSFSIEKLIIDNEICQMVSHLKEGIKDGNADSYPQIFDELITEGHMLASEHTFQFLRSEHIIPGPVINRDNRENWIAGGSLTMLQRAAQVKEKILQERDGLQPEHSIKTALVDRMRTEAKKYGTNQLPIELM